MEIDTVRVRVKAGENEIEIESSKHHLDEVMEKAESLLSRITEMSVSPEKGQRAEGHGPAPPEELPAVTIERDDSLGDILLKLFSTRWGATPRRLGEIMDALRSYGAMYPRSSVAVSLLRMVHAGRLRRFKDEGGFVYVSASPLLTGHTGAQGGE